MARGRFGRRRGGSSNLATLVAQLLREQRAAQDRVMFDAWNNGGLVDGKPVTDGRLLSYIKGRRDGFDRKDPLWDEWNNRFIQYDFSIGESKITLKFQQGKVGAGAVAAYYRRALSSIPKDSAFYREVAGRAAQWAKSASGAARSAARGRATRGTRDKLDSAQMEQNRYLAFEQALTEYAVREGIISIGQSLSEADATELRDMFDRGIMAGDDQITLSDFQDAQRDYYKALGTEIKAREALGQMPSANEARNKRSRFLNETIVRFNTLDERVQYEMARDNWLDATAAANNNPWALQAANEAYGKALQGIYANASSQSPEGVEGIESAFVAGIGHEFNAVVNGKATGPTVAEVYGEENDALTTAETTTTLLGNLDLLTSGKGFYGQTEPGGALDVHEWPAGGPIVYDDSLQPSITSINGQRQVVYLKGEAIHSVVLSVGGVTLDPNDPNDAPLIQQASADGTLDVVTSKGAIGYVFRNPASGQTQYGVYDAQGRMVFTETNPWSEDGSDDGIVNYGGTQAVFSTAASPNGQPLPPPKYRGTSLSDANPVLSDSLVAPKDLLAMTEAGIKGFSAEDLAEYQAKLQKQEQDRQAALSRRDLGFTDMARVGEDRSVGISDPRDIGQNALARQLAATQQTLRTSFMSKASKDDVYVPPPPAPAPKPVAPTPAALPKPKTTTVTAPKISDGGRGAGGNWGDDIDEVTSSSSGRGAGGSWGDSGRGAGGRWSLRSDYDESIGTGQLGGGGR